MMEDHLSKIPMMASASPTESSGSTDDSRGGKELHQEQQVPMKPVKWDANLACSQEEKWEGKKQPYGGF